MIQRHDSWGVSRENRPACRLERADERTRDSLECIRSVTRLNTRAQCLCARALRGYARAAAAAKA